MSRRALLWSCGVGAGAAALVLGAPGVPPADPLPPITLPPVTVPGLVATPPTVSLSPGDGLHVALPPLGPGGGDGVSLELPGFPPVTSPIALPTTPTTAAEPASRTPTSGPATVIGPAPTARPHTGTSAGDPANGSAVTVPHQPHFEAAPIQGESARVVGSLESHPHGGFWSTIGSAAASYWLWFVLCVLALAVRFIAIAAWRSQMRATD